MLYDPKWEVKADPLSLESLIAWLEKMPGEEVYSPVPVGRCLLAQFAVANGVKRGMAAARKSLELGDIAAFADVAFPLGWNMGNCTFGAALERARAVL